MIPAGPGTSTTPDDVILWEQMPSSGPLLTFYAARRPDGKLMAALAREPSGWHMSVSFTPAPDQPLRLPTWDELKDARYRFVPDRARMAALLPPRAEWVDVHPTCLHLWEIRDDHEGRTIR